MSYKCSKCGQPGHKGKDCPNKGPSNGNNNNNNNNKFTGNGGRGYGGGRGNGGRGGGGRGSVAKRKFDGNCNHCGKYGHMAKDCWAKNKSGEVSNVEVVLAAVEEHGYDSEAVFNWLAEADLHFDINGNEVNGDDPFNGAAPVVFMSDGPRDARLFLEEVAESRAENGVPALRAEDVILVNDLEVGIHALRHMEHGLCMACLGETTVRNLDGMVLSAFCSTCNHTSTVSFTSPEDIQAFYDPVEPDDDDSDVSRPVPSVKRVCPAEDETAQEQERTLCPIETPRMYQSNGASDVSSSPDDLVRQCMCDPALSTNMGAVLRVLDQPSTRAGLSEILHYEMKDLTPSWVMHNRMPSFEEYTSWTGAIQRAAERMRIPLETDWIWACMSIGNDPNIFPERSHCTVPNQLRIPAPVLEYMEGSSESESSSGSDTYADMPALEPVQVRREHPQARWNDDDDSSDDDSDGSIPSLEFRDDSSSDDSSVGGASISSHENEDDERLWDME